MGLLPRHAPESGVATVRSVRHTGESVAGRPRLRLALRVVAGGAEFAAATTVVVPLADMSLLRPGVVLPVRLNRDGAVVLEQPAAARAIVRSVAVTGRGRDGRAQVLLGLSLTTPDGRVLAVRTVTHLAPAAVGEARVGRELRVHYLPRAGGAVVLSVLLSA